MNANLPTIPLVVEHLLDRLERAGYEAFAVGGCVRDLVLGRMPQDWDLCTNAWPEQIAACFAHERLLLVGARHGTVAVEMSGRFYEITSYRADGAYSDGRRPDAVRFIGSLREDLARRDFTVNAMAISRTGEWIDCFGGREDLAAKLLRTVGEPAQRFSEDALRLLRALRFAAVYGFTIESETAAALHLQKELLRTVAVERMQAEFCKLLVGEAASAVVENFADVLRQLPLPEAAPDKWSKAASLLAQSAPELTLRLTLLFYALGAKAAQAAASMRRLTFERKTIDQVAKTLGLLSQFPAAEEKPVKRLLGHIGPEALYRLAAVQEITAAEEGNAALAAGAKVVGQMGKEMTAEGVCCRVNQLAIGGCELLAMGIAQGKAVGKLLEQLLEQVIVGTTPNTREALLRAAKEAYSADALPRTTASGSDRQLELRVETAETTD